jgi:DNA polymerase-3 subunit gamma/tau
VSDEHQSDRTDDADGTDRSDEVTDRTGDSDESLTAAEPSHGLGAAVAHASQHENPADRAESLGTGLGDQATGDIVIDSALQDLQNAPTDDLDAQIEAGQRVQQTLQARLSDLGGE